MSRGFRSRGWRLLLGGAALLLLSAAASPYDPQMGLRTFDAAWDAVTDSYYDTTYAGMNWDSLGAAYREQVEQAQSAEEVRAVIREMISRLGDSHFALLSQSPLNTPATLSARRVESPNGLRVGVIRFDAWMLSSSRAFDAAMDTLRTADGLIVDLRGNPGGLIPMLIGVSGHFFDTPALLGTLITRSHRLEIRANPRHVDTGGNYVETYAGPLAVLVDENSYSASEFFAASLQALGRAVVVGRPTTGQALGATYTMLPDGEVLEHAVSDFVTADSVRVEGRGVEPDMPGEGDPVARALSWIDARAVVDRYVAAIGGAQAIADCPEHRAMGTMSLPAQGITGDLLIQAKAPDKMLMQISFPELGLLSSGFDGETAWMIQPMMGPMLLEGTALAQTRVEARYDEALKTHPGVQYLEYLGERTVEDTPCDAVKVQYVGDFETVEYYDRDTGLIRGVEGEQDTPMGSLNVFTSVLAHGLCGSVLIPVRTSQKLMGAEQVVNIDTCLCESVPDSVFALPPVIRTLKEKR